MAAQMILTPVACLENANRVLLLCRLTFSLWGAAVNLPAQQVEVPVVMASIQIQVKWVEVSGIHDPLNFYPGWLDAMLFPPVCTTA